VDTGSCGVTMMATPPLVNQSHINDDGDGSSKGPGGIGFGGNIIVKIVFFILLHCSHHHDRFIHFQDTASQSGIDLGHGLGGY